MANTPELDYLSILKSVAKIEDDRYEYMVSAERAIEAMKLAVEESIPIILNHIVSYSKQNYPTIPGWAEIRIQDLRNQLEPIKKKLGI